ncbi:hypothetical protein AA0116_g3841 [Alternaria tenuissima]|nr:hypothetical protein AA0116_g3841 [Alternaria tenuissima]
MLFSNVFLPTALLAAQAAAHGAVTSYVIDGVTYPGYEGFSPASSPKTIQRQWPDYNPTMSVNDKKVMCNGGTSADLSAKVAAGGKIRANWKQWTHEQGPVMVWMYKCSGDFKSCDGSGKKWFKIDQEGMTAPPLSGRNWGTAKVLKNLYWESVVPKSLAPGNYLIEVTGSGSASPSGDYLANIPGYASQSDPGITVDTYSSAITTYTCPGPKVWTG